MRNCSAAVLSAIGSGRMFPLFLASIQFTTGTVYAWTGIGSLVWNGQTWTGLGEFAGVSAVQESNQVQADNITLSLNGIPSDLINDALNEVSQSYAVQVYLGFMDSTGAIIVDPVKCFQGFMDVPTVQDGGDTCTISITAENALVALQRASNRRYTTQDQHIDYPTDSGFQYVSGIQQWSGVWGKAGGPTVPPSYKDPGKLLRPYFPNGLP